MLLPSCVVNPERLHCKNNLPKRRAVVSCQNVRWNFARWPRGQAMTEYVIVFPVMITLIFACLQFALLYQTKIQLNYAAFESARSGSLNNAQRWALNAGVVRGLAPLHTHRNSRQWLRWARSKVWDELNDGLLEVQIINPSAESFTHHGTDVDTDDGPIRLIPNDHLMYRDSTPLGTPEQSIQDANLLKIRVLYCAELRVPFVNRMINSLLRIGAATSGVAATPAAGPAGTVATGQLSAWTSEGAPGYVAPPGSFEQMCLARHTTIDETWRRYIPIVSQAIIRMQSAPIQDPLT